MISVNFSRRFSLLVQYSYIYRVLGIGILLFESTNDEHSSEQHRVHLRTFFLKPILFKYSAGSNFKQLVHLLPLGLFARSFCKSYFPSFSHLAGRSTSAESAYVTLYIVQQKNTRYRTHVRGSSNT